MKKVHQGTTVPKCENQFDVKRQMTYTQIDKEVIFIERFIIGLITSTLLFGGVEVVHDPNFRDDYVQIVKVCIPVLGKIATLASKPSRKEKEMEKP